MKKIMTLVWAILFVFASANSFGQNTPKPHHPKGTHHKTVHKKKVVKKKVVKKTTPPEKKKK